jgi:hypothetical protein
MARWWSRAGTVGVLLAVTGVPATAADQQTVEQLLRELEAMKQRMEKVEKRTQQQEETIRRQDATIRRLTKQVEGGVAAPAPAATTPPTPAEAPTETTAEHDRRLEREITESIARRIQPSLTAANKTFASQFNPAIGFVIDTAGAYYGKQGGGNLEFRSGEIGISASVDPFVRGYAIINGTSDGIDVEEAAITTTQLPYNLDVKAGRFFADFGRLSKFHDHDLPFVNRPLVLDHYVGGESQADGVEATWLAPLPQYVLFTAGAYNKMGADNERVSNLVPRSYPQFTYLGRGFTFFPISDAASLDLGASYAYTPEVREDGGRPRGLAGVDVTYRYVPLAEAAYRGFVWGTEALYNQERRPVGGFVDTPDPSTPVRFRENAAFGLYSYVEPRLSRRLYPGFLFDWFESIDPGVGDTTAYSPYLTFWPSEFQRLRLQYTRLESPGLHENEFFLQWTVILGSHVHGFKDR